MTLLVLAVCSIALQFVNCSNRYRYRGNAADPDGLWPRYGNNRENQQLSSSELSTCNIKNIETSSICRYTSSGSIAYYGYVTVDNDNNGYATDTSGDIFKFDLDSCHEIWRVNIADTLGFDGTIISRNSPTLYDDIVLIGTPNGRPFEEFDPILSYPLDAPCFLVAFNEIDGSFEYSIDLNFIDLNHDGINDISNLQSNACHVHGFIVDADNKYAYGGMSSVANFITSPNPLHAFQGRMYKINLITQQVENVFFTTPDNNGLVTDRYTGGSSWNFPSLIEDYLVFGSGQLYSYPDRIGDCLLNSESDPSLVPDNNFPFNVCGDDRSDDKFWRCLQDDIYCDTLIILNTADFSIKWIKQTMGVDAWVLDCLLDKEDQIDCPIVPGIDADVTAISTYKTKKGELIAITTTKANQFIAVNIETGKVLISKQTGLWSPLNSIFGSAVDPKKEIAISTFTGSVVGKYMLPNGDIICETGTASAIDLFTGKTKWIFVVPYGRIVSIDKNACPDDIYDGYVDKAQHGRCTIDPSGNRYIDDSKAKIIIPPISNRLPLSSIDRALIIGPVTISDDLVYIPTMTGDVYVLKLDDGEFVTRFECPEVTFNGKYNRAGIQGGVTVINKRIIFYCGGTLIVGSDTTENGNIIQSINFNHRRRRKWKY